MPMRNSRVASDVSVHRLAHAEAAGQVAEHVGAKPESLDRLLGDAIGLATGRADLVAPGTLVARPRPPDTCSRTIPPLIEGQAGAARRHRKSSRATARPRLPAAPVTMTATIARDPCDPFLSRRGRLGSQDPTEHRSARAACQGRRRIRGCRARPPRDVLVRSHEGAHDTAACSPYSLIRPARLRRLHDLRAAGRPAPSPRALAATTVRSPLRRGSRPAAQVVADRIAEGVEPRAVARLDASDRPRRSAPSDRWRVAAACRLQIGVSRPRPR